VLLEHAGSKAFGDVRCFKTRNSIDYGLSSWP
jgi:hypothetical protein